MHDRICEYMSEIVIEPEGFRRGVRSPRWSSNAAAGPAQCRAESLTSRLIRRSLTVPGKPFSFSFGNFCEGTDEAPSSFTRVQFAELSSPEVASSSIYRLKAASDSFVRNREKGTPLRESFPMPMQNRTCRHCLDHNPLRVENNQSYRRFIKEPTAGALILPSTFSALEIPYVCTDTSGGRRFLARHVLSSDTPERMISGPFSPCFIGPPPLNKTRSVRSVEYPERDSRENKARIN